MHTRLLSFVFFQLCFFFCVSFVSCQNVLVHESDRRFPFVSAIEQYLNDAGYTPILVKELVGEDFNDILFFMDLTFDFEASSFPCSSLTTEEVSLIHAWISGGGSSFFILEPSTSNIHIQECTAFKIDLFNPHLTNVDIGYVPSVMSSGGCSVGSGLSGPKAMLYDTPNSFPPASPISCNQLVEYANDEIPMDSSFILSGQGKTGVFDETDADARIIFHYDIDDFSNQAAQTTLLYSNYFAFLDSPTVCDPSCETCSDEDSCDSCPIDNNSVLWDDGLCRVIYNEPTSAVTWSHYYNGCIAWDAAAFAPGEMGTFTIQTGEAFDSELTIVTMPLDAGEYNWNAIYGVLPSTSSRIEAVFGTRDPVYSEVFTLALASEGFDNPCIAI